MTHPLAAFAQETKGAKESSRQRVRAGVHPTGRHGYIYYGKYFAFCEPRPLSRPLTVDPYS